MAKNVNCRYCKGKGTVVAELEMGTRLRAICLQCGRASASHGPDTWRGVGFHSGQLKAQESSPELQRPQDLMTIAQAAKMLGKHPNTISTRINLGQIPSYPNALASHPKKRQRLVSRAEIRAIYGWDPEPPGSKWPGAPTPAAQPEQWERPGPRGNWVECTCGTYLEEQVVGGQKYAAFARREVDRYLAGLGQPLHDVLKDSGAGSATLVAKGLCSPAEAPAKKFLNEDGSLHYQMLEIPVAPYQVARGRGNGPRGGPKE